MPEKILIAEDDVELSKTMRDSLLKEGYDCSCFSDPLMALEAVKREQFDLVVTDLKMPEMDGIELARKLLDYLPDTRVIIITGYSTMKTVIEAMRMGIDSYILKPFRSDELLFNIRRSLERRRLVLENRRYQAGLEAMVEEQTRELTLRHDKLARSTIENIFAIGNIVEARDAYTRGHTERVTVFAVALAAKLGWHEERIRELGLGAPFHDIGKIGVPDDILKKEGPLTFEEMEVMKQHPEIGYRMVRDCQLAAEAVGCIVFHHERYDGTGYPFGMKGENIPEVGRVMAISDAFDAMTSDRVYRPALPLEKVKRILRENSGSQFDPDMAGIFLELIEEGAFDSLLISKELKPEFEKLVTRLVAA